MKVRALIEYLETCDMDMEVLSDGPNRDCYVDIIGIGIKSGIYKNDNDIEMSTKVGNCVVLKTASVFDDIDYTETAAYEIDSPSFDDTLDSKLRNARLGQWIDG